MNRDQKATAIAEIAGHIHESDAIFAVDYRGITVAQVAELRARLRESDATFKVVKNSLTERAAEEAGAATLKDLLAGPTALTFVRGDAATAAKAVAEYARTTQLLPFKGGLMDGAPLDAEQVRSLSRLPSREALYWQLVGVVASPVSGLVRTLNALLGGLAVALGQVHAKKESGEIPGGAAAASGESEQPAAQAHTAGEHGAAAEGEPAAGDAEPAGAEASTAQELPDEVARAEDTADAPPAASTETEPAAHEPAAEDDNQADVSAESQPEDAEANPTKED